MRRFAAFVFALGLAPAPAARAQEFRTLPLASPVQAEGAVPDGCRPAKTGRAGSALNWRIRRAAGATSSAAIAEISREHVDPKYSICIVDSAKATDVEVTVDISPIEGDIDRAGGLAVRVVDANNYYLVRAHALEDDVRLYRVVNGNRIQFAAASDKVASGKPQTLSLRIIGDRLTVGFNNRTLYEARDSTFAGAGAIAVWSKADSLTEFSNLRVKVLKE